MNLFCVFQNVPRMIDIVAGLFLALLSLAIVATAIKLYKSKVTQSRHDGVSNASSPSDRQLQATRSLSHCHSLDCYRCSNNQGTLQTALTRLSYYAQDTRVVDSNADSQNISADIKKSLERLKHPDKYSGDVFGSSPVVFKMSGLREDMLWSLNDFPALQLLEAQFRQVQTEFLNLYRSPLPETKCLWKVNSTDAGQWEIAQLFDQGRKTKAAELCPLTAEILKKIPYIISGNIFGDVSFSVVHPGTHIATHNGSTNCRIRCHLGENNVFCLILLQLILLILVFSPELARH